MPKFIIEREITDAGQLSQSELKSISQKSCAVLDELGTRTQWVHSYVTENKVYCIYIAPDVDALKKHAELGGFPANSIAKISTIIDPITAE